MNRIRLQTLVSRTYLGPTTPSLSQLPAYWQLLEAYVALGQLERVTTIQNKLNFIPTLKGISAKPTASLLLVVIKYMIKYISDRQDS